MFAMETQERKTALNPAVIPEMYRSPHCLSDKMNITIWLTLSRVLLLPLAILPLALDWREGWVILAVVTAVAGLSDFGDGYLARKMKLTTALGANLDYLSDKVFVCAMLIALSAFGVIHVWIPLVVLAREVIISLLRLSGFRGTPLSVDIWGKTKTMVSFMAVVWLAIREALKTDSILNSFDWHGILSTVASLAPWVMLAAVILTLLSGINYLWKFIGRRDART